MNGTAEAKLDNTTENNESSLPGIDVLNTGYGDFELRFDPNKPDEVQKAKETITYAGNEYELVQFHFHSPSETLWHQQSFPLEIHFVHQGKDGKAAILAVLIKGGNANPTLEQILNHLPKEQRKEIPVPGVGVDPSALLPADQRYYAFMGSLTSPPCSEGFQWIVMPSPITASPAQILRVRQETHGTNARPVQPLNNRVCGSVNLFRKGAFDHEKSVENDDMDSRIVSASVCACARGTVFFCRPQ